MISLDRNYSVVINLLIVSPILEQKRARGQSPRNFPPATKLSSIPFGKIPKLPTLFCKMKIKSAERPRYKIQRNLAPLAKILKNTKTTPFQVKRKEGGNTLSWPLFHSGSINNDASEKPPSRHNVGLGKTYNWLLGPQRATVESVFGQRGGCERTLLPRSDGFNRIETGCKAIPSDLSSRSSLAQSRVATFLSPSFPWPANTSNNPSALTDDADGFPRIFLWSVMARARERERERDRFSSERFYMCQEGGWSPDEL